MNVSSTPFAGVFVLRPSVFNDQRGMFYENWRENCYGDVGIVGRFVQDDVSISRKNVLRGLHGQRGQGKLIQAIDGEVLDVVVDVRPKSKTFLQHLAVHLSGEQPTQIYAPEGFVHGFCVLSKNATMYYKCTTIHDKGLEFGFRWDDPTFNIHWPENEWTLSDKDQRLPYFQK
jgi:dTDP-4-dehydrorhamnose 3,5-epimerase